jgi:hypothetical protein
MKKSLWMLLALSLVLGLAGMSYAGGKSDKTSASKAKSETLTGWVSDEKCGAKVNADCAKKCIDGGQKVVFVNEKDKSVWNVTNPDPLKEHAGHHISVSAQVNDKDKTITVDPASIKMVE